MVLRRVPFTDSWTGRSPTRTCLDTRAGSCTTRKSALGRRTLRPSAATPRRCSRTLSGSSTRPQRPSVSCERSAAATVSQEAGSTSIFRRTLGSGSTGVALSASASALKSSDPRSVWPWRSTRPDRSRSRRKSLQTTPTSPVASQSSRSATLARLPCTSTGRSSVRRLSPSRTRGVLARKTPTSSSTCTSTTHSPTFRRPIGVWLLTCPSARAATEDRSSTTRAR